MQPDKATTAAALPIIINPFVLTRPSRFPFANPAEGDDLVHHGELLFSTAPSLGHALLYHQCEMQPSITFISMLGYVMTYH